MSSKTSPGKNDKKRAKSNRRPSPFERNRAKKNTKAVVESRNDSQFKPKNSTYEDVEQSYNLFDDNKDIDQKSKSNTSINQFST